MSAADVVQNYNHDSIVTAKPQEREKQKVKAPGAARFSVLILPEEAVS